MRCARARSHLSGMRPREVTPPRSYQDGPPHADVAREFDLAAGTPLRPPRTPTPCFTRVGDCIWQVATPYETSFKFSKFDATPRKSALDVAKHAYSTVVHAFAGASERKVSL